MREIYSLTPATEKVLTDNIKQIAFEMDCSDKYLYAMLSEDKTDVYAPFRRLYMAAVRAGAGVCHYDNDMAAIRSRYEKNGVPARETNDCIIEKIQSGSALITKAFETLADGELCERDISELMPLIEREKENLERIEMSLAFRKGVIEGEKEKKGKLRAA